jgi:hypothetical protein
MKFSVTADTALLIDGKIKSVEAGEIDTTDKDLIAALSGAKGVNKLDKPQAKVKSKDKSES